MRTLAILLLFLTSCGRPATAPDAPAADLEDGVYEVLAVASEKGELPTPDEDTRVLVFDGNFIVGGSDLPPEHVLLRVAGHAPLALAKPPTPGESGGRAVLLLSLTPEAGKALETLTTTAKRAAVVVNGTIVTVHRIRVPIVGGGLQVSC